MSINTSGQPMIGTNNTAGSGRPVIMASPHPVFRITNTLATSNTSISRLLPRAAAFIQQIPFSSSSNVSNNNNTSSSVVVDDALSHRFPNNSALGIRDARLVTTYYYCLLLSVHTDLSPPNVACRRRVASCLRQLKYLSNSRMVIAWHHSPVDQQQQQQQQQQQKQHQPQKHNSGDGDAHASVVTTGTTTVSEDIFTMLNEECLTEQVPLVWASSIREVISLIQSLARPTGVKSQRISAFGRNATSVNAKMAALLLHTMPVPLLSETEAVRAVDMFTLLKPRATPADMILFFAGADSDFSRSDILAFLQNKVLLTKPRAERLLAVFKSDFVIGLNLSSPLGTTTRTTHGDDDDDVNEDEILIMNSSHDDKNHDSSVAIVDNSRIRSRDDDLNGKNDTENKNVPAMHLSAADESSHLQQQQQQQQQQQIMTMMMNVARDHVDKNTKSTTDSLSETVQAALKMVDKDDDDGNAVRNVGVQSKKNHSDEDEDEDDVLNFA